MNPLTKRALTENRSLVLFLALALLANVLAYLLVVRPLEAKSTGAADRAAAAANALRAAEREQAAADALVKGKATADEELAAFYQRVLPGDMTAARRMTYASLPALARKTGVRYEARTTTIENVDRDGRLERMTIKMSLQGEYENLRQFIYALESAPEFVIIDAVTLVESQGDEPLNLTVDLSTYYRVPPHAS
ncbi:MAG: GspMb/PilO family protein [Vicinamibacterales bacterium]